MEPQSPRRQLRRAMAGFTATVFSCAVTLGPAAADSESPFGDAARVADAALGTMRGGFAGGDGQMLRFAIDLKTSVDGKTIAALSISNDDHGNIHASGKNLGRTFVLVPMPPSTATKSSSTVTTSTPTGTVLSSTVTTPVSTMTGPISTVTGGDLLVTTGLLQNGNGVMTLIQNSQSKVFIQTLTTLNIQLSGLGDRLVRSGTAFHSFVNAMNFSVRR